MDDSIAHGNKLGWDMSDEEIDETFYRYIDHFYVLCHEFLNKHG